MLQLMLCSFIFIFTPAHCICSLYKSASDPVIKLVAFVYVVSAI